MNPESNELKTSIQSLSLVANATNDISSFEKNLGKIINGLEKITYSLNKITHSISKIVLFFLMFLTFADVVGRYFFNKPVTGSYELTGLALALIIFFSLGTTQIKKEHIEIDFLINKLPMKIQESLNIVKYFILFIVTNHVAIL